MPQRVLCMMPDPAWRKRLCLAFAAAGYDVEGTRVTKHANELLNVDDFDLLVIGIGATFDERKSLAQRARQVHQIPVLVLFGSDHDLEIIADNYVPMTHTDETIVEAARRILLRCKREAQSPKVAA